MEGKGGMAIGVAVLSSPFLRMEAVPQGGKEGTVWDRGAGENNALALSGYGVRSVGANEIPRSRHGSS